MKHFLATTLILLTVVSCTHTYNLSPEYKAESDSVIARVKSLQTPNTLSFCVFTDCHYTGTETEFRSLLQTVRYVHHKLNLPFLVNLGDITEETTDNYLYTTSSIDSLGLPYINIAGNHRHAKMLPSLLRQHATNIPNAVFSDKGAFFYFDDHKHHLRYICLATTETGMNLDADTGLKHFGVSSTSYRQLDWLANNALKTDYKVIIISHMAFSTITPNTTGRLDSNYMLLDTIVNAFVQGKTGTADFSINYPEEGASTSVSYDFSSQGAGTVLCSLHGHIHGDMYNNQHGRHEIWFDDALCHPQTYEGTDNPKIKGTVNEVAFDVVTIDLQTNDITCTRFGTGSDRHFPPLQ